MRKAVLVLLLVAGLATADADQHVHRQRKLNTLEGRLSSERTTQLNTAPSFSNLRSDGAGQAGAKMAELLRNINSLARGAE